MNISALSSSVSKQSEFCFYTFYPFIHLFSRSLVDIIFQGFIYKPYIWGGGCPIQGRYLRLFLSETGGVYHLHGKPAWFTVWANGRQKHRMRFPNEIWRLAFYTYKNSLWLLGTELSDNVWSSKPTKSKSVSTFAVRIFRFGILDYLSRRPEYFGNFLFGRTKIVLSFTSQPSFRNFLGNGKQPKSASKHQRHPYTQTLIKYPGSS